jgi:Cu/Ag efflux pump CusA
VVGIAARACLAFVRHARMLGPDDGPRVDPELVRRAARERFVPVLLTTAAVTAALLPFVLGGPGAGREVLRPMAQVVLGGLLGSALAQLFVVPALYARFGSMHAVEVEERAPVIVPDLQPAAD